MIKLEIADDFAAREVDVTLGVLAFKVADIGEGRAEQALEGVAADLAPLLATQKPAEIDEIAATRKAYRALGKDPGRYRPSSEALMRRIASGKPLPRVNDVVDAGNVISLTTRLSIGAYNASAIEGPVTFRRADNGELASAIGRGEMNFEHLPVFADNRGPFGSPTSDTTRTMVSPDARAIAMVLIAFEQRSDMDALLTLASTRVCDLCDAREVTASIITNW